MRKYIFILTLVFCFFIQSNIAYAGFWNNIGKTIVFVAKQKAKENEKKQKEWDRAVKKQRTTWEKNVYEKEIPKVTQKNPLDRPYLQKIDVYKEILDKNKNEQTVKKVIDHIEIYGVDRYQENLSQKHRELLEELIIIRDKAEKKKSKAGEKAAGLVIMGGIAYILRLVIFKIPV